MNMTIKNLELDLRDIAAIDEAAKIFSRLEQIAPRTVKMYESLRKRSDIRESDLAALRCALAYWENENDKTVAALNRYLLQPPARQKRK